MKHTPAPWTVNKQRQNGVVKYWIETQPENETHFVESTANARLIAAAPELLVALQILTDALSRGANTIATQEAIKQARAAIDKAKGE